MRVVSIDPGLRGCGVAVWENDWLASAAYIRNAHTGRGMDAWAAMAQALRPDSDYPSVLVCECPQVYQGSKQKGDPNDLIELAGVVGAIAATCNAARLVTYLPAQWKAQMTKEVCHQRIASRLLPAEEIKIVLPSAASLAHNVFDAIGIGLKYLGRFEPVRAPV